MNVEVDTKANAMKKAYYAITKQAHPDKTSHLPTHECAARDKAFKDASNAGESLGDAAKRAEYDRTLLTTSNTTSKASTPESAQQGPFSTCGRYSNGRAQSEYPPWCGPLATHAFQFKPSFQYSVEREHDRTCVNYHNSRGWRFSVEIAKKFELNTHHPPVFTAPHDTSIYIDVTLSLIRGSQTFEPGTKDVLVDLFSTPGGRQTSLASRLSEDKNGIALKITLAPVLTGSGRDTRTPAWTFAFEADRNHLVLESAMKMRVTQLSFHSEYPSHVFRRSWADSWPLGSPMAQIAADARGAKFHPFTDDEYCMKVRGDNTEFWQLVAVGYLPRDDMF